MSEMLFSMSEVLFLMDEVLFLMSQVPLYCIDGTGCAGAGRRAGSNTRKRILTTAI